MTMRLLSVLLEADHPLLWGIDVTQCRFPNPAFATLTDSWKDTTKERYDREDFTYKDPACAFRIFNSKSSASIISNV